MTESKNRVPLAYVGYWKGDVIADRILAANGRLNAVAVEGHPPETLIANLSATAEHLDRWRIELRWREVVPLVVQDAAGTVVVSTRQLYGEPVDVSGWELEPLPSPPRAEAGG